MTHCPFKAETREEFLQRKYEEAEANIRLLRQMTLPPAWENQSEEAIRRWKNSEFTS